MLFLCVCWLFGLFVMSFKDECGICKRVLRYSRLRRCVRCGKLYCRDCMTVDVSTGDPTRLLCLNCARRSVLPRSTVSRASGLTSYLKFRGGFTDCVKLSFARLDGIIGDNLPMQAYKSEGWWSNVASSVHAKGWLDAGWNVESVDLKEGFVVFRRVKVLASKRRSKREELKPFTPVRVRFPRRNLPSKTKVSKLYARIKNLERQRSGSGVVSVRGGFKGKPAFDKRLADESTSDKEKKSS